MKTIMLGALSSAVDRELCERDGSLTTGAGMRTKKTRG